MGQDPSLKADQEISHLLLDPKVHYHVHNSPEAVELSSRLFSLFL